MDKQDTNTAVKSGLKRYISPLGAWALSFGCAVGWGAFVMPGTTFLPMAGPLGTALGIAAGAAMAYGIVLSLEVVEAALNDGEARCAIRKFSGDDPDVTDGVLV